MHDDMKKSHINYCLNNDFYTENTQTCQSQLGKQRVIPYHWKGMNDEQKRAILNEQEKIRQDVQLRKQLEKEEEECWAAQQEQLRRNLIKLERERNRGKGNIMDEIVEYNKLKAKEDKVRSRIMYSDTHSYKLF